MTTSPQTPNLLVLTGILVGCVLATIWLVILGLTMYVSYRGPSWVLALCLSLMTVLIGLIWTAFYRRSFISADIRDSDPRIYVTIKEHDPATVRRLFTLTNHGGGVAHNVQVEPLTVSGVRFEFPPIAAVPVRESRDVLPKVVSKYPELTARNDLFYWLEKDWSTVRSNVMAEFPVSVTVAYDDYTGTRSIKTTMMLVFYPLQYRLQQQEGSPSRDNPLYEFRRIKFSLMNGSGKDD